MLGFFDHMAEKEKENEVCESLGPLRPLLTKRHYWHGFNELFIKPFADIHTDPKTFHHLIRSMIEKAKTDRSEQQSNRRIGWIIIAVVVGVVSTSGVVVGVVVSGFVVVVAVTALKTSCSCTAIARVERGVVLVEITVVVVVLVLLVVTVTVEVTGKTVAPFKQASDDIGWSKEAKGLNPRGALTAYVTDPLTGTPR